MAVEVGRDDHQPLAKRRDRVRVVVAEASGGSGRSSAGRSASRSRRRRRCRASRSARRASQMSIRHHGHGLATVPGADSSAQTVMRSRLAGPKVVTIATSAASRPRPIATRPIARHVEACVERPPAVAEPAPRTTRGSPSSASGPEIADLGEVPGDVASRDAERAAEGHAEVGEVAAHAAAGGQHVGGRRRRQRRDAVVRCCSWIQSQMALTRAAVAGVSPKSSQARSPETSDSQNRLGRSQCSSDEGRSSIRSWALAVAGHRLRLRRHANRRAVAEGRAAGGQIEPAADVAVEVLVALGRRSVPAGVDQRAAKRGVRLDEHDRRRLRPGDVVEAAAELQPHGRLLSGCRRSGRRCSGPCGPGSNASSKNPDACSNFDLQEHESPSLNKAGATSPTKQLAPTREHDHPSRDRATRPHRTSSGRHPGRQWSRRAP